MLTWEHGGFSLDAAVRMAGDDRAGLARLLRYCARPAFALERLTQVDAERVVYRLPKPQPDGRPALSLTPLEQLDRLAGSRRRVVIATVTTGCWRPMRRCASARDHPSRVRTGRAHRPLPLEIPLADRQSVRSLFLCIAVQRVWNGRNLAQLNHSQGRPRQSATRP